MSVRILLGLVLAFGGTAAQAQQQYPTINFGGSGRDGAFTYAGQGPGVDCPGGTDICRGGVCGGSPTPNGTCLLFANSAFLAAPYNLSLGAASVNASVAKEYTSMTITAGTIQISPGISYEGSALSLRVQEFFLMTGGTIDLKGKGTTGATGGTCVSSNAGKAGGNTSFLGGIAGASGNNPGGAGTGDAGQGYHNDFQLWAPYRFFGGVGGGGGTCAVTGQDPAIGVVNFRPSWGGAGGGGSGCAATCATTCGAGGRGGGGIVIETPLYDCSGGTITVAGNNGAATGGGGGGGGTISIVTRSIINSSCTMTVTGGTGGASGGTCGAGGAGGAGFSRVSMDETSGL